MNNLTAVRNLVQAASQDTGNLNGTDSSHERCLAIKASDRPRSLMFFAWLFFLVLAFGAQSASAQTTWSMGYYWPPGVNPPLSAIQWSALTHVVMVGGNPNSDGSVTLSSGFSTYAPAMISAAHANGVKVLYVLTQVTSTGWAGAASSGNLSTFIANIMSTVNTYGFDGVDIDWEESFDETEETNLASGLRTALGTKLLTFAAANGVIGGSSGWLPILPYMDRLNLVTVDENGTWESETWFNSPLYTPTGTSLQGIDSEVRLARSYGYPMAKVGIELPFYGYLQSPSNGPYQAFGSSPSATQMWYDQIRTTYGFTGYTFDTTAHSAWRALNGTSWIQWDNAQSITDKVNYAKANGLGGWTIWLLGEDYNAGQSPTMPLLDAVSKAFHSSSRPLPPTNLIISVN